MHNSFDIEELDEGGFLAKSHNFPECVGDGDSVREAIESMDRKIQYIADNRKGYYTQNVRDRISKGLACRCGEKLKGHVVTVQGRAI